ncbi:chromosome loss-related protein [Sporothrix curviconia]|uniref:Chromosome loss-related protein n=1 Tax=Sporothrix curviconia TaxID=1260050 RepID=A0ABP0D0A7_9PEZI
MAPISVPLASRLPSSLRIAPTNATVTRVLSRLSRPALLSLALDWLDEANQSLTAPYLRNAAGEDDDDSDEANGDFYPPAASREALQEHYTDLQSRKGSKRDVLDRILEGDWRHGLSLYQLAMADLQHLYDHPTSQKWTAFQIVPLKAESDGSGGGDIAAATAVVDKASLVVPRFHPSSFLRNLQAQILPDIKVHYNFDRHKHLPLLLLRIFILDSPYNTSLAAAAAPPADPDRRPAAGKTAAPRPANIDSSRTIYIAFPDASPFVYLSSATASSAGERAPGATAAGAAAGGAPTSSASVAASLRSLVVEAIPKALSQAHERYALKPTNMATRNLTELLQRRGAGRTNTAGGGWGIYADEKTTVESPLSTLLPPSVASRLDGAGAGTNSETPTRQLRSSSKRAASPNTVRSQQQAKRRKQVAAARFGQSAKMGDGCGVERVDIVMQDPFPGGRRFDHVADEEEPAATNGDEPESGQAPARADRRRSKGGRRSQVDAVLARDEEEAEEEATRERDVARKMAGEHDDSDDEERGGQGEGEGEADKDELESTWRPRVALTFHGPHVFAGIRQLVEAGVIDGEKMPGWMTGEEGVTVGAVRHGRIRGHKGSGMP